MYTLDIQLVHSDQLYCTKVIMNIVFSQRNTNDYHVLKLNPVNIYSPQNVTQRSAWLLAFLSDYTCAQASWHVSKHHGCPCQRTRPVPASVGRQMPADREGTHEQPTIHGHKLKASHGACLLILRPVSGLL